MAIIHTLPHKPKPDDHQNQFWSYIQPQLWWGLYIKINTKILKTKSAYFHFCQTIQCSYKHHRVPNFKNAKSYKSQKNIGALIPSPILAISIKKVTGTYTIITRLWHHSQITLPTKHYLHKLHVIIPQHFSSTYLGQSKAWQSSGECFFWSGKGFTAKIIKFVDFHPSARNMMK